MKRTSIAIMICLLFALTAAPKCGKKVESQPGKPEPTIEEKRAAMRIELGKLARQFRAGAAAAAQIGSLAKALSTGGKPILKPEKANKIIEYADKGQSLAVKIADRLEHYADIPPSERVSISSLLTDLKDTITEAQREGLLKETDPQRVEIIRAIFAGATIVLPFIEARFGELDAELAALWPAK
ncbi:MAG: hypothetical protein L0229_20290 [Blastocatellia bacterium]|nr:hypothetical protein [Blastocatellia bacterium]